MPLTSAELTDLVHRYYPKNVYTTDERYESQAEAVELRELRKTAQAESSAWNTLLRRLHQELPECSLWELPFLLYDPCRCVRVSLADSPVGAPEQKAVVLLASILAPVHHIYASWQRVENHRVIEQQLWHPPLPPEYQTLETRLNSLAQSVLGTSTLPNDQLIHCLFTDRLW
jgi:hypothetical protein